MTSDPFVFRFAKVIVLLPTLFVGGCSPSPPDSSFIHLVGNATSIQASSVATVGATCPSGEQLIGGGFTAAIGTGPVAVTDSYPSSPNTWTVTAHSGPGVSGSLVAVAYCFTTPNVQLSLSTVIGNTIVNSPPSPIPAQLTFVAPGTATCPRGSVLTGGGYHEVVPVASQAYTPYVSTEGPSPNSTGQPTGWQTTLTYVDTVTAPTATVFAICARSYFTQGTIVTANIAPVGKQQTGDVQCPPKTFTSGGGYSLQQSTPTPWPYTVYSSFSDVKTEVISPNRRLTVYDAIGWHSDVTTPPNSPTFTMSANCIPFPTS
jgi:hypothetical protein